MLMVRRTSKSQEDHYASRNVEPQDGAQDAKYTGILPSEQPTMQFTRRPHGSFSSNSSGRSANGHKARAMKAHEMQLQELM
jgi:hypothetical protein